MSRPFQSEKLPPHSSPVHWSKIDFKNYESIDLEIGCGVGLHPIQYCQKNPDRLLIAIEHTKEKFESFQRRVQNHSLQNLIPVHANAISWITQEVPENSLSRVFILYPNPNLKNPAKRWFRMPFFNFLLTRLQNFGEVHLATNEELYFTEALDLASRLENFKLIEKDILSQKTYPDFQPRTHFEKKYFLRQQNLYCAHFQKETT